MKKKLLVLTSLFASTAMLGACGNLGKATSGGGASQAVTSKKKGYQTTGQTDTDYYQGIIKDGRLAFEDRCSRHLLLMPD